MKKQETMDFKKMDWSKVDREKAEFIYNEAAEYNDRLIESINNLNSKASSLLAAALPVFSAAAGFLLGIGDTADKTPVSVILLFASVGLARYPSAACGLSKKHVFEQRNAGFIFYR